MNWYQQSTKEIFHHLGTSESGLPDEEARVRLGQHGPNKLAEAENISKLAILVHQFTSPLIYILLIAGVVTVFLREFIDAGVIFAVVILNAVIGFFQEYKAEESVRALKKMVVPKAKVLREGREKEIQSEDLVPGDIVLLSSGVRVPADLRLFKTIELRVEESMLTGESLPAEKGTFSLKEANLTPGDQKNMVFMGTIVLSGRAKGVVVETGQKTVLGQIATEVREATVIQTPLQDKLMRFAKVIGSLVIAFSALVFGAGILLGEKASEMFMIAVATAVSAIPEGLPVAVTITMAIGVARMARRNAVIRKLPAVETLGSTTVIGSDKTGTLTKNEMTVKVAYDGEKAYRISGIGYEPEGEILHELQAVNMKASANLLMVFRIGMLCNESNIYEEEGEFKVEGDPTEGALIVSAMKAGLNRTEESNHYPQTAIIPFESEHGYMATLHKQGGEKIIFVKGAPEKILDMCTECAVEDKKGMREILDTAHLFAKEGMRVLAMGYKKAPRDIDEITHQDVAGNLIFAGLQGMIDPPRPDVMDAVKGCKKAGIKVAMITGDHAATALAIAKMIGITGDETGVMTGKEIEAMTDNELFKTVEDISVFARVSPQHKLRVVEQLIRHGEVVAVTGDGVNDAPALKAAHIGIAMGKSGTDVAKEASDMVLADDNFASIFAAVEEGRVVYDNIKKVTIFLISCGFGELIAIVGTIVMGYPIPYIPAQILWLNLVTNGLQDVALAFEPSEKGVLNRPPRNPKEGILSSLMVQRTLLMGLTLSAGTLLLFITNINAGVPLERARTIALTTMVFFQFYQALNCRSETQSIFRMNPLSNQLLFISMIAAFLAQLSVIYVPAFQWVFRTVPITISEWMDIILVSTTIILVVEADKWLRRRRTVRGKHS